MHFICPCGVSIMAYWSGWTRVTVGDRGPSFSPRISSTAGVPTNSGKLFPLGTAYKTKVPSVESCGKTFFTSTVLPAGASAEPVGASGLPVKSVRTRVTSSLESIRKSIDCLTPYHILVGTSTEKSAAKSDTACMLWFSNLLAGEPYPHGGGGTIVGMKFTLDIALDGDYPTSAVLYTSRIAFSISCRLNILAANLSICIARGF